MKKIGLKITLSVVALLILIVAANAFYVVEENEYACKVRFSRIVDTVDNAGLCFKIPFIESVKYFPKAMMLYDIPASDVLTSDKQNMRVDSYVLWRITEPLLFYQSIGSTSGAEQRLDAITYSALKNMMGTLTQSDIINEDDASARNDIYAGIAVRARADARGYGIEVMDVKIKRFDLPESNENAVYNRMISERKQMAEKFSADGDYDASLIRNDVDKQVNIIISNAEAEAAKLEAEGEAEYMRMLAAAYNTEEKQDFYEFILALNALEKSLSGSNKTVILGRDSKLAQLLIGE